MAQFSRVNGDSAGVAVYDVGSYVNGTTTGAVGTPIQPQGPKLQFFDIDLGADPTAQFGTGGAVEAVLRTVTQMSTLHMYQFNADGMGKVVCYPVSGQAAADLQTAIQALGTVNTFNLSVATVAAGTLV
jgi:hypothetical protein